MSFVVVINWSITEDGYLTWWVKSNKPTSKGRNYSGEFAGFRENKIKIESWEKNGKDWMVTDNNGKKYLLQFSTRYNNRNYPHKCFNEASQITDQLKKCC